MDAIATELAERDEDDPATLYWDPLALIEIEDEDGDTRTENPAPRLPVVSPLPEWELWACAQTVMRQHGEQALIHVAERLGALELAGDAEGVATWKAIARRIQSLSENSRPIQ